MMAFGKFPEYVNGAVYFNTTDPNNLQNVSLHDFIEQINTIWGYSDGLHLRISQIVPKIKAVFGSNNLSTIVNHIKSFVDNLGLTTLVTQSIKDEIDTEVNLHLNPNANDVLPVDSILSK